MRVRVDSCRRVWCNACAQRALSGFESYPGQLPSSKNQRE
jgi:hypothetical protein